MHYSINLLVGVGWKECEQYDLIRIVNPISISCNILKRIQNITSEVQYAEVK